MDYSTLSDLIDSLERGTNMHICVAFVDDCGNQKTHCTDDQTIHNQPICMAAKKLPNGLDRCFRCRIAVQKAVIKHRKIMAGLCLNGVYEYCKPVVYEDRVVCVIFIGNILTQDARQRQKLESWASEDLLETMERSFTYEDCVKTANILDSYILFLLQHYGMKDKGFDPLVENIKSYIRENLAYDFNMQEMSGVFNYTPKYLGRIFKSRTGRSIKEYTNHLKIKQAKTMLANTDLGMETIAVQVGFNSLTYFDRVFSAEVKLSPQAYRASVKGKKKSSKR